MLATVWCCDRCGLQFVSDNPPKVCPQCRRYHSGSTVIRLLGRDIEISSVRLYGENPLKKAAVGLDSLRLGDRCSHGWMASMLCPECN